MRTVRASELGSFLYCRRAWWLRKLGVQPANQTELAAGSDWHAQQSGLIARASLLRLAAWAMIFVAAVLLAIGLTILALE
jgi:hypothetical protein